MSDYVYLENELTQELTRRGYKAAKIAFWIGIGIGFAVSGSVATLIFFAFGC